MKQFLFISLICLFFSPSAIAQTQVENGDLETWEAEELFNYEEPTGYWTTANGIKSLGELAPITTFKETEKVKSGSYAAKMVTDKFDLFDGIPVTGTLAIGEFKPDILNFVNSLERGKPFTEKPTHLSGHYMYFPENNDSAAIYLQLFKYDDLAKKRDTIAEGWLVEKKKVGEYTHFNIPIEYYSDETPDSMTVVAVSSAAGHLFIAEKGSTLYVDDLAISYSGVPIPIAPEVKVQVYPNPTSGWLTIDSEINLQGKQLYLYNIEGQLVFQKELTAANNNHLEVSGFSPGQYIYQISEGDWLISGGKIEIIK